MGSLAMLLLFVAGAGAFLSGLFRLVDFFREADVLRGHGQALRSGAAASAANPEGQGVRLEGLARPHDRVLRAPLTGTECVAYGFEVKVRRADNPELRGPMHEPLAVVLEGAEAVPFRIEDSTGEALVVPEGSGRPTVLGNGQTLVARADRLPPTLGDRLEAAEVPVRGKLYLTEWSVPVGGRSVVVGSAGGPEPASTSGGYRQGGALPSVGAGAEGLVLAAAWGRSPALERRLRRNLAAILTMMAGGMGLAALAPVVESLLGP